MPIARPKPSESFAASYDAGKKGAGKGSKGGKGQAKPKAVPKGKSKAQSSWEGEAEAAEAGAENLTKSPKRQRNNTAQAAVDIDEGMPQAAQTGKKGRGRGRNRGGRRRNRRTQTGWEPEWLETRDQPTLYLMRLQCKMILALYRQFRMFTNILQSCLFAARADSPFKETIKCFEDFIAALAEARAKAEESGDSMPAIGAPHIVKFICFVEALILLGIGDVHKKVLETWITDINQLSDAEAPFKVNLVCQSFTLHDLQGQDDLIRVQFNLQSGPIRDAVLCALNNLGVRIASGPPQEGFFEEELSEWLSVLSLDS